MGDGEGEALENGISASIKGPHRAPEPLPLYEDMARNQPSAPGEDPEEHPHWQPDLRLPPARTGGNEGLLFIRHLVCGILLWHPEQTKMTCIYQKIKSIN